MKNFQLKGNVRSLFAVGHLALGYMVGKAFSRILNRRVNISLIFVLSLLPDVDLLMPYIRHRGPTHSVVVMVIISVLFLRFYGRAVIPYLLAAAQHSLIGDYLTGGVQLFWPINRGWYGLKAYQVSSMMNITIELVSFFVSMALLLKTRDFYELLSSHLMNLSLIVPIAAICVPLLLGFPVKVPIELIIPHVIYLTIFAISILKDVKEVVTTKQQK